MIRRAPFIFIFITLSLSLAGQTNRYGLPLIKNYPPAVTLGSEQNWSLVQDQRGVLYVGNDDRGILEYDGVEWRTIETNNNIPIRSFTVADDGTVFIGATAEIGYLEPSENGNLEYRSLMPKLDSSYHWFRDVWRTYSMNNHVYFCSQQFLLDYSRADETFKIDSLFRIHALFTFLIDSTFYLGAYEKGLMVKKADTIVQVPGGEFFAKKNIFGLVKYDEERFAVATSSGGITLLNHVTGAVDSMFASGSTNEYLGRMGVSDLKVLPTGKLLVATLNGGLVTVDRDGEICGIITKDEGMQAQTVYYTLTETREHPYPQVWAALSTGVAKAHFNSPFRIFSEEQGFLGVILTINSLDNKLFIGTFSGLYMLEEEDGRAVFKRVEGVNFRVWSLEKFTLEQGTDVLLAATDEGIIRINGNGQVENLDNRIREQEEQAEYWGYKIKRDPGDPNRVFIGRKGELVVLRYEEGEWTEEWRPNGRLGNEVRFIDADMEGNIWFGTDLSGIGRLEPVDGGFRSVLYTTDNGLPSMNENEVFRIGGHFRIGTREGFYRYDASSDSIVRDTLYNSYMPEGTNAIGRVYNDREGGIWISLENSELGWMVLFLDPEESGYSLVKLPFYGLPDFETDAFYSNEDGMVWFSRSNLLYHYEKAIPYRQSEYRALVRRVKIGNDSVIFNGTHFKTTEAGKRSFAVNQHEDQVPGIPHAHNNIEFRWSAPYFDREDQTSYSYKLEGFSQDWSEWDEAVYKDFTNLPHGNYTFSVKARNVYLQESIPDSYSFVILRPWYLSFVAFLAYIILAVLVIYIIIVLYTRRLKNENIRLEGIIQDRTAEIRKQKEELTDSIEYASRIQRALLPPDRLLDEHGIEHFILFKPRDIVSGDFYWFGKKDETIFVVAADCTGHGVPGAFMSMLGISFMDEIVIKSGVKDTNQILDALRQHVITSLRQTGKSMDESTKDGMDLAMVAIEKEKHQLQFSGAYNPLYGVRKLTDDEKTTLARGDELNLERGFMHNDTHLLFQVKGDQMPIGISEKDFEFSAHTLDYDDLTLYLFTDGYVDQFGGPSGKKFMSKNFKKLLLDIQHLSLEAQHKALSETLNDWMADVDQIDDVLVIGLRLTR